MFSITHILNVWSQQFIEWRRVSLYKDFVQRLSEPSIFHNFNQVVVYLDLIEWNKWED